MSILIYEDQRFDFFDSSPHPMFNPEKHGLKPSYRRGTDAYKAVNCTYGLRGKVLFLDRLEIDVEDAHLPAINGRLPEENFGRLRNSIEVSSVAGTNRVPVPIEISRERSRSDAVYIFTDFRLPFSGKLRIAREYANDYCGSPYSSFSVCPSFDSTDFKRVIDLKLEDGLVVSEQDISKEIEHIRVHLDDIRSLIKAGLLGQRNASATTSIQEMRLPQHSLAIGMQAPDPDAIAAWIEDAKREGLTPRWFVTTLPEHRNQVFTLRWLASQHVPLHLIDQLQQIVREGAKEEDVCAWFLQALLQSPAGKNVHHMAAWAVDWHASRTHLAEHARGAVEAVLSGVTAENWPAPPKR